MPQNKAGRWDAPFGAAVYGDTGYLRIGDFPNPNNPKLAALEAVSADATSPVVEPAARGIQLLAGFSDLVTKCDIKVYRVDAGGDTLVTTFLDVEATTADGLFITGNEGIDLLGRPVKVRAENFSGGGSVSLAVRRTS
jgi:hypothetical protein